MKSTIIASLIANNQKELNERIKKIDGNLKHFQVDIMDGKFVKNKSMMFDFKLPKGGNFYEAHLMVKNPLKWVKKVYKKVDVVIFHIEACKNAREVEKILKFLKSKKKKAGIAINPKTKVSSVIPYVHSLYMVLVMTVIPGKYGSKFLPEALKKVKALRAFKSKLQIEVDGGITDKTIKRASRAGANRFISGSYLQRSNDVKGKIVRLKNHV